MKHRVTSVVDVRALIIAALTVCVATGFPALAAELDGASRPVPAAPELPERIQDELELEDLRREKERRDLEIELGINHDLTEMQKLLVLLTTAEEVQDKLKRNPELRDRYDAIVGDGARSRSCTCLITARVLWLGTTGSQSGQADIRLGEDLYNVRVGGNVGNSRCRLDDILVASDDAVPAASRARALLSCGGTQRERRLYSATTGP